MQTQIFDVTANSGDEKRGHGKVEIYTFSPQEKVLNSFKKLALFWLIAIFCVFIPALHFFLVPLFLGLGIYFFLKTFKVNSRIVKGDTTCPACGKSISIEAGLAAWPLTEICQNCVTTVRINLKQ
jgi:hypothetical protein